MESDIFIMEIKKINDTTVAKVGTQEVRQIFSKSDLLKKKEMFEARLAEIDELLAALE